LAQATAQGKRIHVGPCNHWMCRDEYRQLVELTPRNAHVSGPRPFLGATKCPLCRKEGFGKPKICKKCGGYK
jgi:hypothetical protein